MKTSHARALLLRRHQHVEPRLNTLREAVLHRLPSRSPAPALPTDWRVALRELFWPARLAWFSLALLGLGAFGLDQWVARSEPSVRNHPELALRTRGAGDAVSKVRRLQDAQLAQWMDEAFLAPSPAQRPASPTPSEPPPAASPRRQRSSLTAAVWVA